MLCGVVCSSHKVWYTGLLKIRIAFICSQVLWGQTSTNMFAQCCSWCNQPCLHSAVTSPSFPCQGYVPHMLQVGLADWGSWPTGVSPGTLTFLSWSGQSLCNWPAFGHRSKATNQHPVSALWVTNRTGYSSSVGSDLISQLHHTSWSWSSWKRGHDGLWSPHEGWVNASFTWTPSLFGFSVLLC